MSAFIARHAGRLLVAPAAVLVLLLAPAASAGERYALVVTGASGAEVYAKKYDRLRESFAATLRETFEYADDRILLFAEAERDGARKATADNVCQALVDLRRRMTKDDQLVVLLVGHGTTTDGEDAKFNLVGPDLSAAEWADLLKVIPGRLVFVNATSASFPFLRRIAGRNRVVLTATDSSAQQFETVFPEFFVRAFEDPTADADKNGRVSMWEAFLFASAGVKEYFDQKGQLPTERPLLDDTGAGIGREALAAGSDGAIARITYLEPEARLTLPSNAALAALVTRQAELQTLLEALKARKENMPPDQYDAELEKILVELARVSIQIRAQS